MDAKLTRPYQHEKLPIEVNNSLTKIPIFAASVDLPRDERSGLNVVLSLSRAFSSSSFSIIALDFSYCMYAKMGD
jgi:hypothetical protein